MKIQSRISVFMISLVFVLVFFQGCAYPEEKRLDYDYLADGIQEIQIVSFIYFTESEYDKDGDYYQYHIIRSLTSEETEPFLTDLSQITFISERPPRSVCGYGVILIYENKKIYISAHTYEDEGKPECFSFGWNEEFNNLLEKTLEP